MSLGIVHQNCLHLYYHIRKQVEFNRAQYFCENILLVLVWNIVFPSSD